MLMVAVWKLLNYCQSPINLVSFHEFRRLAIHNLVNAKGQKFSLGTYKLHSLRDYVQTIQAFGTTDSYSMQMVSLFKYH
jgi:hypothetical protein